MRTLQSVAANPLVQSKLNQVAHSIAYEASVLFIKSETLTADGDWMAIEPADNESIKVEIDYLAKRGLLERHPQRYQAYSQGLAAGFLTVADVREAESLPHIPGTETLNRPANMIPAQPLGYPNTTTFDLVTQLSSDERPQK